MICPECNHENVQGTKLCTQCSAVLTQTELTTPTAHRTNQVWNTEIEKEQNQANSRTAMIVLAAAIVLVIALIAAACMMLPSLTVREQGQSFTERMDDFFAFIDDTTSNFREPVPEAYASIPEGTDEEFIDLFEEFLEKAYDDDYGDLPRLVERYYDEFAEFRFEGFTDPQLSDCSARTIQALDKICRGNFLTDELLDPSVSHTTLQLEGNVELYSVVEELYEHYGILYNKEYIPEYYIQMLPICYAQLEVEYDLTAQLNGAAVSYTEGDPVPYLSYTNNTLYELDITIYNDYYIGTDFYSDESFIPSLMPGKTAIIPLPEMPAKYEDHYTYWFIEDIYIDGINIYDYYW